MFSELLSYFHQSPQGQQALALLQQQGWSPEQSQTILQHATPAAATAMHQATAAHPDPASGLFSLFGGHGGASTLLGSLGSLLGFGGQAEPAPPAAGLVNDHVASALARGTGMESGMASQVASTLGPLLSHFAHSQLSTHPNVTQQFGGAGGAPQGGSLAGANAFFAPQGGAPQPPQGGPLAALNSFFGGGAPAGAPQPPQGGPLSGLNAFFAQAPGGQPPSPPQGPLSGANAAFASGENPYPQHGDSLRGGFDPQGPAGGWPVNPAQGHAGTQHQQHHGHHGHHSHDGHHDPHQGHGEHHKHHEHGGHSGHGHGGHGHGHKG